MTKIKTFALGAILVFVFSMTGLAQQAPPTCDDGQVPVGGRCGALVEIPPVDEETKTDEKSLFDLDFFIDLLKFL